MSQPRTSYRTAFFSAGLAVLCYAGAAHAQDQPATEAVSTSLVRTTTELTASRWFTPATAGTSAYDYGFTRPSVQLGLGGWRGDWGGRVAATIFGVTTQPGQTTPYVAGGGWLGDLQARRRFLDDRLAVNLGLRVLTFRNVGYATLGVSYDQPLTNWLDLDVDALAGTNVNLAYVLDGSLGLKAKLGVFGLSLGFRAMDLQCGCIPPEPALGLAAPYLAVSATY